MCCLSILGTVNGLGGGMAVTSGAALGLTSGTELLCAYQSHTAARGIIVAAFPDDGRPGPRTDLIRDRNNTLALTNNAEQQCSRSLVSS